ncbi:tRNA adenosine(34) deaminase TadA [Thiotrichales bacterium 19S3-7]|nr:tRNA adenosine(34) deaminase TadA [Thiotrichales bacterium 19S3-7]MCF6802891.1 tRNA adenosine(34) deaminase TadA [Thiotrichales bacterium 19S3-11]
MNEIKKWMSEALKCARYAQSIGEVPVGAVCVLDNQIIAQGWNQSISACDPTAHAEVVALREAAKAVGNYRLLGVDLYVTLEPCAMCAGAMIHSRINQLVYAASDLKSGAISTKIKLFEASCFNHYPKVISGVLKEEASELLSTFFKKKRQKGKTTN